MKKVFSKCFLGGVIVCLILALSVGFASKSSNLGIRFTLEQFKMKIGATQGLSAIISGKNVDYNNVYSSDPTVLRITDGNMLKAVSTGISTLSYPMVDSNGDDKTIYCYVEVTKVYEDKEDYRYTPYISCGKYYVTKTIADYILDIETENGTFERTTDSGLYKVGDDYIFRGEDVKNFIRLGNHKYRICGGTRNFVTRQYGDCS